MIIKLLGSFYHCSITLKPNSWTMRSSLKIAKYAKIKSIHASQGKVGGKSMFMQFLMRNTILKSIIRILILLVTRRVHPVRCYLRLKSFHSSGLHMLLYKVVNYHYMGRILVNISLGRSNTSAVELQDRVSLYCQIIIVVAIPA